MASLHDGAAGPQPLETRFYLALWREPLAFSTYVPADMITEATGDTIRFVAEFGGQRQDSALVQVVGLPHGAAPDRGVAMAGHRRRTGSVRASGRRPSPLAAAATAVLVVLGMPMGCDRGAERGSGLGDGEAAATRSAGEGRTKPRALDLVAYRSPADFPLPFRAWIPAEANVKTEGPDGGASLRISMPVADSESAPYLNVFVFPSTSTEEEAQAEAEAEMTDRGVPVSRGETPATQAAPDRRFDWALSQIPFAYRAEDGRDHTATVLTGRHDGRFFNMTVDGPLPRARWWPALRAVLDSWRWSDGTPLVGRTDRGGPGSEPDSGAVSPDSL